MQRAHFCGVAKIHLEFTFPCSIYAIIVIIIILHNTTVAPIHPIIIWEREHECVYWHLNKCHYGIIYRLLSFNALYVYCVERAITIGERYHLLLSFFAKSKGFIDQFWGFKFDYLLHRLQLNEKLHLNYVNFSNRRFFFCCLKRIFFMSE